MGSDLPTLASKRFLTNFNPRSPHGERLLGGILANKQQQFQSTLPAWGATQRFSLKGVFHVFQSTLPAWGATNPPVDRILAVQFQSTLPAWGATASVAARNYADAFQSTLPAWGATSVLRETS